MPSISVIPAPAPTTIFEPLQDRRAYHTVILCYDVEGGHPGLELSQISEMANRIVAKLQTNDNYVSVDHFTMEMLIPDRDHSSADRRELQVSTHWELSSSNNLELSQQLEQEIRTHWKELVGTLPVSAQGLVDHGFLWNEVLYC